MNKLIIKSIIKYIIIIYKCINNNKFCYNKLMYI